MCLSRKEGGRRKVVGKGQKREKKKNRGKGRTGKLMRFKEQMPLC